MLERRVQKIKSLLYSTVLFGTVALSAINIANSAEMSAQDMERLQGAMQQNDYPQALELIASLSSEMQQQLDIRFYRATSLAEMGKTVKAIEAFKRLIENAPGYPEFYNNLAVLLVKNGKLLEAQQILEQGLKSNKSYAMLYSNLTALFESMARRSYAKALQIRKNSTPILTPLATLEGFAAPTKIEPVIVVARVEKAVSSTPERLQAPKVSVKGVSSVADEPANIQPTAATKIKRDEPRSAQQRQIEAQLYRWISHWENRKIEDYIDSYSPNFKSRGYSNHGAWMKGRSRVIRKAGKIDISIKEVTIKPLSPNRVQTEFMMDYRSTRYSDRSKKRVIFKQIEGRWRIVRELTLQMVGS